MNLVHLKPCLSVRTFNYREVNWNEFLFGHYVIRQILEHEPKQKKP